MQEVIIGYRVLVQRHLVAIIILPTLAFMTLIVWGEVQIANMEFAYAVGISDNPHEYAISAQYRSWYGWWWAGPAAALI